jgi:two-component system chemotaxis sensor kinase CheA
MTQPAKLKVLIVDDEKEIGHLIIDLIVPIYEGIYAGSAEEALRFLGQHGSEVVCIVSDYKMNGMNGIELRQSMPERCKEIPFILLSGYITKDDALAGLDAKISAMLPKPFDVAALLELIKKHARDRESTIRERIMLEQIFIEESSAIVEELEPLIMSLEQRPNDMETLNTIFRLVHTIKGSSGVLESNHIRSYVHRYEDLLSKLKSGALAANPEIVSILLQGFDIVGKMIQCLKTGDDWTQDVEQLARIFDMSQTSQSPSSNSITPGAVSPGKTEITKDAVSVPTAMLDEFMELSGEITVIRNMVNKLVRVIEKETPSNKNVQHLGELLDEMHKINSGMQGRLIETRKVPLNKVFRPLPRTVRDTAKNLGKTVDFKVEGDHIRVDSSLAQVLSDSLVHIVRNSLDHGIETREMRIQRKKRAEGHLTIKAIERGEEIVVSIQDDGGGLDASKIKKKAVERGLYSALDIEQLSEQKIYSLIFESGFSTASQVTDVSGRGVGMDMVRSSVQKIKGRVEIESELGKGTTFSLHLPIPKSVLIINSLVVQACGRDFAIPQDGIARLLRLEGKKVRQSIKKLEGTHVLDYEGQLIPLTDLGESLGLRPKYSTDFSSEDSHNILIARTDAAYYALAVDRVLDSEEIVVKSVGKHMERLKVYAGATFMGDGCVGLILSVDGIAEVSGVIGGLRASAKSTQEKSELTSEIKQKEILIFELWCQGLFAVPLAMVYRLEEVPSRLIQDVGGRRVLVYRDQIMPLVDLTDVLGITVRESQTKLTQDPISVFVSMINDRYVGFIIKGIKDVCQVLDKVDDAIRDRDMIAGSIEVNGKVISMLEIYSVLASQGLLKSLDPAANLQKFAHGPEIPAANSASLAAGSDLVKNDKNASEASAFAGDGWGLF